MASPAPGTPVPYGPVGCQSAPPRESEDSGLQIKHMGLKVHYTFDKDSKVNCLAKLPQILPIQTIPLDERNRIGIVDLRLCIQAVAGCSPELFGQPDLDYTVYAVDYSEPDTPLVGQGMLSWIFVTTQDDIITMPSGQMVTGRVTRNLLAAFGNGAGETLEVRLKLTSVPRLPQSEPHQLQIPPRPDSRYHQLQQPSQVPISIEAATPRAPESPAAMTPTGTAEWNSFLQCNPQISGVKSPALIPVCPEPVMLGQQREVSVGSAQQIRPHTPADELSRVVPTPVGPSDATEKALSRPSSRSSRRRSKQPTGRPRGRPRTKMRPGEGNTSGCDDATEGEDGPAKKKRATTTKVDRNTAVPFGGMPESLRVAASTSGSLRNFRPIAASSEAPLGRHLQEVPRAPTPVPEGPMVGQQARVKGTNLRRQSTISQELSVASQLPDMDTVTAHPPSQEDARSPLESAVPTPAYSEDSPGDIGSSPPVPRAQFMRSSPPPSSPILPPMPQADSGFMSGGMDDLFEEEVRTALEEIHPKAITRNAANVGIQVFKMRKLPPGTELELTPLQNFHSSAPAQAQQPAITALPTPPSVQTETKQTVSIPLPSTESPDIASQPAEMQLTVTAECVERGAEANGQTPHQEPGAGAVDARMNDALPRPDLPETQSQPIPKPTRSSSLSGSKPPRRTLSRSASLGPLALPTIPASDPVRPQTLALPGLFKTAPFSEAPCPPSEAPHPPSEAPCPPSEGLCAPAEALGLDSEMGRPGSPRTQSKASKNYVKKRAIKQRLETAIQNGEMPPFCSNCGAIETPTWRKMWTQDKVGVPPEVLEFSDKPGQITAMSILEKGQDDQPVAYRVTKKTLNIGEDRTGWDELLLCNPCGIWLGKHHCHRPASRWDLDKSRLGKERKRGADEGEKPPRKRPSRSKKARKGDTQINPTSEAYFTTDPLGPGEPGSSPKQVEDSNGLTTLPEKESQFATQPALSTSRRPSLARSQPSSTHSKGSRGTGTANSPIALDLDEPPLQPDLGSTRRLLFPSPRKDGVAKVLSEVSVNIVRTSPGPRIPKEIVAKKEDTVAAGNDAVKEMKEDDDLEALFCSPGTARPSTPPPKEKPANNGAFKTPMRPTPNHRPITRSVSKSMRSSKSASTPSQLATLQQTPSRTPSRTPRSRNSGMLRSASVRRSPRHGGLHAHLGDHSIFETPLTATINQLLSEAHDFTVGDLDIDLGSLPTLDGATLDDTTHAMIDFGTLLSTDAVMPSSPPGVRQPGVAALEYMGSSSVWAEWNAAHGVNVEEE